RGERAGVSAALAQRTTIARAVAALRRRGWPAGRALGLVADELPAGALREEIAAIAAALGRGEGPGGGAGPGVGDDALLALLAAGDAAGADAMLEAARGLELEAEAAT